MTQEKLGMRAMDIKMVNRAIDMLMHGKDGNVNKNTKQLNDELLWLDYDGKMKYYNNISSYRIYFDKAVENMCLLSVLVRDWSNRNGLRNNYENWIRWGK